MNIIFAATTDLLPLWIILGLLAFFGLIVIGVILVKRKVGALQIKKDDIPEEEAIQQELDRILVPIKDEKTLEEMKKASSEDEKK